MNLFLSALTFTLLAFALRSLAWRCVSSTFGLLNKDDLFKLGFGLGFATGPFALSLIKLVFKFLTLACDICK